MKKQITKSKETDWIPLAEEGVYTRAVFSKALRLDETTKRTGYPNHSHPAGEEIYVLEVTHSAFSKKGCTMLFIVPEEVVILT